MLHDIANFAEVLILCFVIFLVMCIWVTMLSGTLFVLLKKFFGKKAAATETEPGQVPKKAKKAVPAVAAERHERVEPTFGESSSVPVAAAVALAAAPAAAVSAAAVAEEDEDEAPDAATVARDAAFADRMADQFAAEPVTA